MKPLHELLCRREIHGAIPVAPEQQDWNVRNLGQGFLNFCQITFPVSDTSQKSIQSPGDFKRLVITLDRAGRYAALGSLHSQQKSAVPRTPPPCHQTNYHCPPTTSHTASHR